VDCTGGVVSVIPGEMMPLLASYSAICLGKTKLPPGRVPQSSLQEQQNLAEGPGGDKDDEDVAAVENKSVWTVGFMPIPVVPRFTHVVYTPFWE